MIQKQNWEGRDRQQAHLFRCHFEAFVCHSLRHCSGRSLHHAPSLACCTHLAPFLDNGLLSRLVHLESRLPSFHPAPDDIHHPDIAYHPLAGLDSTVRQASGPYSAAWALHRAAGIASAAEGTCEDHLAHAEASCLLDSTFPVDHRALVFLLEAGVAQAAVHQSLVDHHLKPQSLSHLAAGAEEAVVACAAAGGEEACPYVAPFLDMAHRGI
jgi:hypothetical protein